jgi:hypothetical protein
VVGNVVNNIYSMSAINEMSRVIAQNVFFSLMGIRKAVGYRGLSSFLVWVNQN